MHHTNALAHMDLKPENVAFTDDYDLTLIDFGITVKASEPRSSY